MLYDVAMIIINFIEHNVTVLHILIMLPQWNGEEMESHNYTLLLGTIEHIRSNTYNIVKTPLFFSSALT